MKKMRIIWIAAALTLALTAVGCSAKVEMPESADHVDLEKSSEVVMSGTAANGEESWRYEIATYTVTGEHCAADDPSRVLMRHSYQIPVMTVKPVEEGKKLGDGANRAANTFNAYFAQVLKDEVAWFDEMAEVADKDYETTGRSEGGVWKNEDFCYTDEATLSFWNNSRAVCITTDRYSYSGGAHPTAWRSCALFDLGSGKEVALSELTDDVGKLQAAVEKELLRQIKSGNLAAERGYFDDYAETLQGWMERPVSFDKQGMTVVFSVYDIAPYAAGEQAFAIPYGLVKPYLNKYGTTLLELS